MAVENTLPQTLRAMRRRVLAQVLVREFLLVALVAGAFLVAVGMVNRWVLGRMPWDGHFAGAVGIATVAVALLRTLTRRLSLPDVAKGLDLLGRTRDRLVSVLAFSKATATEMQTLALRECAQFIANRDFRALLPWSVPRHTPALLVPAVALLMLQWEAQLAFTRRAQEHAEGQAHVERTAQTLEQLAREAEKKSGETRDDELKRIAAQLKRSADELRAEATNKEQAEKAALRQLSQLETLVKEMQKAPAAASSEEMKQLAAVLARNDATKAAAAAMLAGNMELAAKELEAAAKDEATARKFQQTLQEALEQLAAKRKLSEQLQQLADQLQQRAGPGNALSDALQRLAQMLRQMQQQGGHPQKATQQALNNLLSALQNLKFGESGDQQGTAGAPDAASRMGEVTVQLFGTGDRNGQQIPGVAQLPTGLAGSDRDPGTTATPFAETRKPEGEKGAEVPVRGQLGQGESLSALLPSAGDQSKSARRYKELYEAMAPAAQEAVLQENIPLGSRFFIKRYFEAIRPRE